MEEAGRLQEKQSDFLSDPDIPFSFMVALYEGVSDPLPTGAEMEDYADWIGSPDMPVLGDRTGRLIEASGWDGRSMPGQCVLTPDMVMLDCYTGEDDERAAGLIEAHYLEGR